ncbi:MAG: hypothetical protein FJW40_10180 [Acidobacteria bacterium]|nr:hypothetical protein [Acidobacteriota bacterium]
MTVQATLPPRVRLAGFCLRMQAVNIVPVRPLRLSVFYSRILLAAGALPAFAETVSFSRHIAPVLAFHCNGCHDEAAPLSTQTRDRLQQGGSLGPAVVPGDPERSPLIHYLEGRRGEARRMPLGEPALPAEVIARFRDWIAGGAADDAPEPPLVLARRVRREGPLIEISIRVPVTAYLTLKLLDGTRLLHQESRAVKRRNDRMGSGLVADWVRFPLTAGTGWPLEFEARFEIRFSGPEASRAEIRP